MEDSLGHKTQYFHQAGLVTKAIDAGGGITLCEYNEHAQKLDETDQVGSHARWTYDERGNTTSVQAADGGIMALEYNERDALVRATDVMGGIWTWSHDERGRVVERTDPAGATTRIEYRGERAYAITDALAHVFSFGYDEHGMLAGVHLPNGGASLWQYDRLGRAVQATDANGNGQRRHFDLLNRLTRTDNADGSVRRLTLDPEGNITRFQDDRNDVHLTYQGLRKIASRSEAGTVVRFDYDTEEQLIGITNQLGFQYSFERDALGDVRLERGFDGVERIYVRDAKGRITRTLRPTGVETRYKYDKMHRPTEADHVLGSTGERVGHSRFTYRKDGHVRIADNGTCTVKLDYDVCGRVVKETHARSWVASQHDALGRRIRIESSAGTDVEIERDAMGEPIRVACNRFEARITRDLLGFPIELELPGDVRALWQRDSLGRPVRHDVRSHEQQARIRSYHWAPLFELTMVVDAMSGPVRYEHDVLSNLVAARYDNTVEQRICDAVGNLLKERDKSDRQYGPAGQLLDSAEARNTYDAEGNLVERIDKTGQAWRYAWAADGTLSAVRRPDGNMVQFAYDAFGRRISKHCGGRTTHWTWDGNKPLHEWTDGASDDGLHGTAARPITWLFEPETYKPMAKLSDKTESIVTDHIGAPTLMLDAEGTRTWSADLSTYGEVRELEGDRFACPFRWPGQYEDAETGLYYNRARYYDPVAGQYTSQDPIRLHSREYNFYRYVSDPLEQYDPLGIDWNYHLTDSNGNTYYHGRASDNDTMAGVARRHAANEGTDGVRFGAGDTMTQITPSGTAYDAVRGIEQRGIAENALLGRNSGLARGNLINGMSEARQASPTGQARLRAADDILDGRRASEMPALNTLAARVC